MKIFDLELYKFEKLAQALDKWGFPKIDFESGFKVIKGVDFEKAYKAGDIRFEEDGIYLDYKGYSLKGYMFIQEPYLERYNMRLPKFHIVKCKVIQEFLDSGKFNLRYQFSNSECNDLTDRDSKKNYKDMELSLCGYCSSQVQSQIDTTKDFHDLLGDQDQVKDIELDIFGYTKGWDQLSRAYRELHDYTCEECGIMIEKAMDKRFIHVHHRDADKTNNTESNLSCLCILCHANQDDRHRENFSSGTRNVDLKNFVQKYSQDLEAKGNRYLSSFKKMMSLF